MSYGRILEVGHYIWGDGEGITFDDVYVPNETINIFLAQLNDSRNSELESRIQQGRKLIEDYKKDIGELDE
jgi:hypothetical protein